MAYDFFPKTDAEIKKKLVSYQKPVLNEILSVFAYFKKSFPKVHLALHQGSPNEIAEMLSDGRADIGIATEAISQIPELTTFPYYSWHHAVIVPKGHPLEKLKKISLEDLAEHSIVTYHEGFTEIGRAHV